MKCRVWICYLDDKIKSVWFPEKTGLDGWKYAMKTSYPKCQLIKGTLDFKLGK